MQLCWLGKPLTQPRFFTLIRNMFVFDSSNLDGESSFSSDILLKMFNIDSLSISMFIDVCRFLLGMFYIVSYRTYILHSGHHYLTH